MPLFASTELVPVEMACPCPGTPHDLDTVWLRADLPIDGALAAMNAWDFGAPGAADMTGILGRIFVQFGVSKWTFVDEDGKPIPLNMLNVARLDWNVVLPIAEKANDLYGVKLLAPLVARVSKSSPNGRTAPSTSRKTRSSAKPRKRSKPSTTATTPAQP